MRNIRRRGKSKFWRETTGERERAGGRREGGKKEEEERRR